ncbi:ATP-dependent helicase [bacterium]|nr:ATP-dependent helicase [bacterium]
MIYEMTLSFEEQQQLEGLLTQFDSSLHGALGFLFKGLNREQVAALSHSISDGKPLLILAGAGSGKTSVLTRRVALLLLAGVPAERIFVSTFTVKAAGEMKERVGKLLTDLAAEAPPQSTLAASLADMLRNLSVSWIGTFHSLCLRLLRERRPDGFAAIEEMGFPPGLQVLSDAESREIIQAAAESLPVKPPIRDLAGAIDLAANELLTPEALDEGRTYNGIPADVLSDAWTKYMETKKSKGVVDFTDLLYLTASALAERRSCAEGWKGRFSHILIDEYQDTNVAQYAIATELAAAKRNLFVVGDDDQSIYGFRGADVRNIRAFTDDYPDARVVRLIRNYRSTPIILAAANAVLLDKTDGMDKTLLASAEFERPPEKIVVFEAQDETDELNFVVFQMRELIAAGFKWRDIVIFYRVHELAKRAAETLQRENIPFLDVVSLSLTDRDVIRILRSVLIAVHALYLRRRGQFDAIRHGFLLQDALRDIWRIGTIGPLNQEDRQALLALTAPERILLEDAGFVEAVQLCKDSGSQKHLEQLWTALRGGAENLDALTPFQLVEVLAESLGLAAAAREDKKLRHELTLLYRFLSARIPYPSTGGAGLEQLLSAFQSSDRGEPVADLVQENVVRLLTIHAAKGLEFPAVIVLGVEEDILPFVHPGDSDKETAAEKIAREDEELRLFYVAITRAKQQLVLTSAARREWYGKPVTHRPSRFLSRLPPDLVERGSALNTLDRAAHRTKQFFRDIFRS